MKTVLRTFLSILILTALSSPVWAQSTPTLAIMSPTNDQTSYGAKLPILFKVNNFKLVDTVSTTKPTGGEGHILLWLDDVNGTTETATKVAQDSFIYSDVAYSNHTLKAELVTTDNKPLSPPQSVTVNFKTAAVPAAEEPTTVSGFDKTTALVILVVVAVVIVAAWWYTKDEDDEIPAKSQLPKKTSKTKTTKKKPRRK